MFAALPVPIVHCIDETPDDPAYNDLTGEYIIELEFAVEGTILQYIHLNEGLVNPAFLALIVRQFLRGLEWQHGKNILHAHLKSGNILVFPWPFSKVGDLASSIDLSTEKVRRCLTSYNNDSPEMIQVEIKGMGLQPEMLACLLTSFHLDARWWNFLGWILLWNHLTKATIWFVPEIARREDSNTRAAYVSSFAGISATSTSIP